jgi:hypothetical protein
MMNTRELMDLALEMAGMQTEPPDSAIYVSGENVRRILIGIDIGAGELLMARTLGYDAVIAHHPVGVRPNAWQVYRRHVELMVAAGVPEAAAREAVEGRLESMAVSGQSDNYDQVPAAARLLRMPFLNIHNPLDEVGRRIIQGVIDRTLAERSQASLREVAAAIAGLGEFRCATTGVKVLLGDPDAPAGRAWMAHAAYTNGGHAVAQAYFVHGVETVVYIHVAPPDLDKLRADGRGQLIVTGHIASDSVGINPYIAELEKRGLIVDRTGGVLPPSHC